MAVNSVYGFPLSYVKQNINLLYNYIIQKGFWLVGGIFKFYFIFLDLITFSWIL